MQLKKGKTWLFKGSIKNVNWLINELQLEKEKAIWCLQISQVVVSLTPLGWREN